MPSVDFDALKELNTIITKSPNEGRDKLIRLLEDRDALAKYGEIINSLLEKSGLLQYIEQKDPRLDFRQRILLEAHRPIGLPEIVLHKIQAEVYCKVLDGTNVILSAPTSFGKSLLIDAIIASDKFKNIVIIVPSIALIEETRSRLHERFSRRYKIISFPGQSLSERNIFVFTQERYTELQEEIDIDFFVIDEFYKLSPINGDIRSFTLNSAFYSLIKQGIHFLMIGPNIQSIEVGQDKISYEFIRSDFATVSANIYYMGENGVPKDITELCAITRNSTLVFCKSSNSAYELGENLCQIKRPQSNSPELDQLVDWLKSEYHPEWTFVKLLEKRIGVHHSGLPRSISHHILRLFNEGKIDFLLCTNTIIEGVNTSAKNMIIYDNKIATKKFDFFTFNNIKGRAGRMFKHFVGNIYINNPEPQECLPIIDIPAITQPANFPDTLLLNMDASDLSETSIKKLRYLHAQNTLPIGIIASNQGVGAISQLNCAEEIIQNAESYSRLLCWNQLPNNEQMQMASKLIFAHFMNGKPDNTIFSATQLANRTMSLLISGSFRDFLKNEINNTFHKEIDDRIENGLKFIRNWCDFNLPKYLAALDSIQKHVLGQLGHKTGDYSFFCSRIKSYFEKYGSNILEEYGIPLQVSSKIEFDISYESGPDGVIRAISNLPESDARLHAFEKTAIHLAKMNI